MEDHHASTLFFRVGVKKGCLDIIWIQDLEAPDPGATGTIVETYTPTNPTDPTNPPVTFTFPFSTFETDIMDVKYWTTYVRPSTEEPIPDPQLWTRLWRAKNIFSTFCSLISFSM